MHLHGVCYLNFCHILSSTEQKFHVLVILTFLYLLVLVQWLVKPIHELHV